MKLRDYQQRALDQLYVWFERNRAGHPCLVLPTGSGKSHLVAALCKDALQNWPETRILMLTHVRELIEQNAEKMRQHWPGAPLGIYSAGLKQRVLDEPITFAGIQSVRDRAEQIGHVDLAVIDECHLANHKTEGGYRKLIAALMAINPALRVVGLTATPYRLGHGLITEKTALFDALIEPVSIAELVYKGYLAPLRSKLTEQRLDASGVKKRGGEYIEKDLQAAVDTEPLNRGVVAEIIARAEDRRSWLLFCAGVAHAEHVRDELIGSGIPAACILGTTPSAERSRLIEAFKAGELRALTNANVLTTGFDYPDIDLIALLRPTLSPGLYVQMAGRGMRPKSHTNHCLVLDFAGVVQAHGPITAVQPPAKKGETGEAPTRTCPDCGELCHASVRECPACGHVFPVRAEEKEHDLRLRDQDIMGRAPSELEIADWRWREHISRTSGKRMLAVTYYGRDLSAKPITEYLPVMHDGYAGQKALVTLIDIAAGAGAQLPSDSDDLERVADTLTHAIPPATIRYRMDGKFHRIINRDWSY